MAKINDGTIAAIIESRRTGKVYEIRTLGSGRLTCSCMAYRFAKGEVGYKNPCKHIKQVLESPVEAVDVIIVDQLALEVM